MRITERRLRSIIRTVIKEAAGDYDATPSSHLKRNQDIESRNMPYAQKRMARAQSEKSAREARAAKAQAASERKSNERQCRLDAAKLFLDIDCLSNIISWAEGHRSDLITGDTDEYDLLQGIVGEILSDNLHDYFGDLAGSDNYGWDEDMMHHAVQEIVGDVIGAGGDPLGYGYDIQSIRTYYNKVLNRLENNPGYYDDHARGGTL